MRDHDEPAQAEQVSAVRVGVQNASRDPRRGANEQAAEPGPARRRDFVSKRAQHTANRSPSVFSATLPVKPSQTTTSASPSSSARPPCCPRNGRRRPRAARASRASAGSLSASSPIPKEPDCRVGDVEELLGEDRTHVRELDEVLGPPVCVRAAVDQHRRPAPSGITIAIPGRWTPGSRRRGGGTPQASHLCFCRDNSLGVSVADSSVQLVPATSPASRERPPPACRSSRSPRCTGRARARARRAPPARRAPARSSRSGSRRAGHDLSGPWSPPRASTATRTVTAATGRAPEAA